MLFSKIENPKKFLKDNEKNLYIVKSIGIRKFEEFPDDIEMQINRFVSDDKFNINEIITLKTKDEKKRFFYSVFDDILYYTESVENIKNTYILIDGLILFICVNNVVILDLHENLIEEYGFDIENFKILDIFNYNAKFFESQTKKKLIETDINPILESPLKDKEIRIWSSFYLQTETEPCVCESIIENKETKFVYKIKLKSGDMVLDLSEIIDVMNRTFYNKVKERTFLIDKRLRR